MPAVGLHQLVRGSWKDLKPIDKIGVIRFALMNHGFRLCIRMWARARYYAGTVLGAQTSTTGDNYDIWGARRVQYAVHNADLSDTANAVGREY